jgi:hypothetical protein
MTVPHDNISWRKSTRSETGDCVELAHVGLLRDSKNAAGPVLPVSITALVDAVKAGTIGR